jgi:hypothetical protein
LKCGENNIKRTWELSAFNHDQLFNAFVAYQCVIIHWRLYSFPSLFVNYVFDFNHEFVKWFNAFFGKKGFVLVLTHKSFTNKLLFSTLFPLLLYFASKGSMPRENDTNERIKRGEHPAAEPYNIA